jgi:hypothetical protein
VRSLDLGVADLTMNVSVPGDRLDVGDGELAVGAV